MCVWRGAGGGRASARGVEVLGAAGQTAQPEGAEHWGGQGWCSVWVFFALGRGCLFWSGVGAAAGTLGKQEEAGGRGSNGSPGKGPRGWRVRGRKGAVQSAPSWGK